MLPSPTVAAPDLKIFFHDRCFDGAASAAVFAEFYRGFKKTDDIAYRGMSHSQRDPFQGVAIDGAQNACLDFRYSPHADMNWWFDHHLSAFQPPSLRAHFEADQSGNKYFDPSARSCAVFTHKVLTEKFGYDPPDTNGSWAELLLWADKIDAALFDSAQEIVELSAPALQVMLWLKNNRDPALATKMIESLGRSSLAQIAELAWVQERLPRLLEEHHRSTGLIAGELRFDGRVATYDMSEELIEVSNGFAVYMLEPASVYSIGLVRSENSMGITVGKNPWAPDVGEHNIARICEQYGGGGHEQVGGIHVPGSEVARARDIVEQIRLTLNREVGEAAP